MYHLQKTDTFNKWLKKLKDKSAKTKILYRLQRLEDDEHFGDCQPVGNGITELRIHYAKGYRIYLKEYQKTIVILLCGGTKASQTQDILKAKALWDDLKNEDDN
jgi:putative addiction module killer protein